MRRWTIIMAVMMVLALLVACGPAAPEEPTSTFLPESVSTPTVETASGTFLTLNPVEESMPIYGGTLLTGYWIPRTFDAHQKAGYGPTATLPVFNQLVMFDINYKECVSETIIGDLAESWEMSEDGMAITFKLHQGVKWHDGVPFTANDVIYSLDKINDVNRSAISDWFPAYESTEKIDDYTVKVHLKYSSASFMMALAQGESQIQPLHLAGTDDQSADFMVGTGPFILEKYITQVHLKFKRNPDYFKIDKYGNQLPYLDGIYYHHIPLANVNEMLVGRRLDLIGVTQGAANIDSYEFLTAGAPELLWQKRERYNGNVIFINTSRKPLDDIRIRRAMALVLDEEQLIIGSAGNIMFGLPGTGLLHPAFGLPEEEITTLMGWDKPYEERVTEAQQLMAEAGYPDGFDLNMMATSGMAGRSATMTLAEALRTKLKINVEVSVNLGTIGTQKRLDDGNYDTYQVTLDVMDPVQLANYFGTDTPYNYSKYSNPELDEIMANLDHIMDPDERREAIWEIERILLTDLPALPTGHFPPTYMPYYPHVKNLRWNYITYSNISRLEDVWIDESLRLK
ncbi:MAG: ABC transporter substrate-binding protein [Dehalococcoidales bacterium]|jgi:peptide/nickel transport system substrate-binding protein